MLGKSLRKWRLKKDLMADLRQNPASTPPKAGTDAFVIQVTENIRLKVDEAQIPPPDEMDQKRVEELPRRLLIEPRRRKHSLFRWFLFVFVFLFFFAFGCGFNLFRIYLLDLPDPEELINYEPDLGAKFMDQNGLIAGERFEYKREIVRINDVPALLKNAVVAIEDSRFYDHKGVDFIGIARALYHDIRVGRIVQGGSTITQQVAKLVIVGDERTIQRKIREALVALKMELKLPKDDIMEIYLNQAWFGGNIHGVKAASQFYFDKELGDLTVGECALLAGMLKNANLYSPTRDLERARNRQLVVLKRMFELGFIDEGTFELEKQEPIRLSRAEKRARQYVEAPYFQSWVEQILTDSPDILVSDPEPRRIDLDDIKTSGMTIRMTLDLEMQRMATEALRQGLSELNQDLRKRSQTKNYERNRTPADGEEYYAIIVDATNETMRVRLPELPSRGTYNSEKIYTIHFSNDKTWLDDMGCLESGMYTRVKTVPDGEGFSFELANDPHVQGALAVMDPHTGRVLAMQGGFDYAESTFNRCTQAYRQPGSGFKPILYSFALSFDPAEARKRYEESQAAETEREKLRAAAEAGQIYGAFTPASILPGNPIVYYYGNQSYSPGNHEPGFGDVSMRHALAASINIPAVRMLDDPRIILDDFIGYCISLGFNRERLLNHADRTLPLGTVEVTPLQMSAAFSAFANGGIYNEPYFVDRILDRYSNIIYEHKPNAWRALGEEEAFLTTSIMNSVINSPHGTAYSRVSKNEFLWSQVQGLAGKTGTTNNSTDAWFIGLSPDLVVAVFVGYDALQSLGSHVYGSGAALPTWIRFMEQALADKAPLPTFTMPAGIVTIKICPDSGQLAGPGCPYAAMEYFKAGTEPKDECRDHARERILSLDGGTRISTRLRQRT